MNLRAILRRYVPDFGSFLVYLSVAIILAWITAKEMGLFSTPLWLELLPYFSGAVGILSVFGKILDSYLRLGFVEKDVRVVDKDVSGIKKDMGVVKSDVRKLNVEMGSVKNRLTAVETRMTSVERTLRMQC